MCTCVYARVHVLVACCTLSGSSRWCTYGTHIPRREEGVSKTVRCSQPWCWTTALRTSSSSLNFSVHFLFLITQKLTDGVSNVESATAAAHCTQAGYGSLQQTSAFARVHHTEARYVCRVHRTQARYVCRVHPKDPKSELRLS